MLGTLLSLFRTQRAAPCRRSSPRKAPSVTRARLALEELESRFVPSGVTLSTQVDPINGAHVCEIKLSGSGNSVSIDHGWNFFSGGYLQVTGLNGTPLTSYANSQGINGNPTTATSFIFNDSSYAEIWVDGGTGGNSVFVNAITRSLVLQSLAGPNSPTDQVYLGNGTLQGIQSNVTLLDYYGSLSVNVNGQNDTATRTVVLGGSSAQPDPISQYYFHFPTAPTPQCAAITGLVGSSIYYQTSNINNLTVNVGPGVPTVFVTNTYVPTTLINDGLAIVDVGGVPEPAVPPCPTTIFPSFCVQGIRDFGPDGSTQGIQGALNVTNTVAHGTILFVDDARDPVFRTFYVSEQVVNGPLFSTVVPVIYGSGMSPSISYGGGGVGSLELATGKGGAAVYDSDYLTPTSLVGSAGATNSLYEQVPYYGHRRFSGFLGAPAWVWARVGSGTNQYSNVSYSGF